MLKNYVAFLVLLAGLVSPLWAQQSVDATIQGGVVRPLSIAIPNFIDESGNTADIAADMSRVIAYDLRSSGLFRDLPSESFIGTESFDAPVEFANWSGIGAELYLKGAISAGSDGKVSVKFRLYDVVAQSEMGDGMQFSAGSDEWRRLAHKVADEVYERVTGEGPYFDSRIVFVAETGSKGDRKKALAIMDTDGANLKYLTDGSYIVLAPRWAGNARDIIFTSYRSGQPQVVLMNTQSGETQVLSDLPGLAFAPRFAPDGQSLLVSLTDDSGNTDIFRIDMSTGQRQQLTSENSIETAPSFSPDGSQIVFESDRSGTQQLYVMPATGGAATQISSGAGRYASPVWSPQGDLIAFTKISAGQFHIGTMNIDGSNETEITSAFIDEGPTWAPNGRVLMFYRETAGAGGAPKLQSMSLTGLNMVEVKTPDFASDPSWSNILP